MAESTRIAELLNHAALRWLIARIRTSGRDAVATLLFDEFADALDAHLARIERVLMPSLRALGHDGDALQYIDTHWYLKRSLADLRALDRRSDPFAKRLLAVCNRLERQMMREATELLALVHDPSEGAHATA